MRTVLLPSEHVREVVRRAGIDALMDLMISRFSERLRTFDPRATIVPPREGFSYTSPELGLIEWMPVMQAGERVTIKVVGYHPTNPGRRRLPTILSTVGSYCPRTGHLIGLSDATLLTALRTGAASAVASRLMARADSHTLGVIGCGAQAVTQVHALSRVFRLDEVIAYDIEPAAAATLKRRLPPMDVKVTPVGPKDLDGLVAGVDILCTATSVDVGAGPVFGPTATRPWLHVNAVGADFPGKVEVPLALLEQSIVCPDFRAQAVKEGECQQLTPDRIGPELVEIAQNAAAFQHLRDRRTVFDSTGWAVEDQLAMELMIELAEAHGLGLRVEFESTPQDPLDPYEGLLPRDQPTAPVPTMTAQA